MHIGDGVVISPYSIIRKNIDNEKMVGQYSDIRILDEKVKWSPELIK